MHVHVQVHTGCNHVTFPLAFGYLLLASHLPKHILTAATRACASHLFFFQVYYYIYDVYCTVLFAGQVVPGTTYLLLCWSGVAHYLFSFVLASVCTNVFCSTGHDHV